MTFIADAVAIGQHFATEFALLQPTVPIDVDNAAFKPPDRTPWVRITILPGDSQLVTLGNRKRYLTLGTVTVQVFTPSGQGDGLALEIATDAATVMRSKTVSGVRLKTPSVQRVGVDGPWFQLNVNTPYQSELIE